MCSFLALLNLVLIEIKEDVTSYLYSRNPYTRKDYLRIETVMWCLVEIYNFEDATCPCCSGVIPTKSQHYYWCQKWPLGNNQNLCNTSTVVWCGIVNTRGSFNINTPSHQYRHSQYKDKTVSRQSYLYNGNLYTLEDRLNIATRSRNNIHEDGYITNTVIYL